MLSDLRFPSYERFFLCFPVIKHFDEIAHERIRGNSTPFGENQSALGSKTSKQWIFYLFLIFDKEEFNDKVNQNCCTRPVKGEETTSNTKIVANMPATVTAAAVAAAATSTSGFAAIVVTVNTINQTFMIFFPVGESRPCW